MAIPLLVPIVLGVGTLLGVGGTVAVTDAADEIGDAAAKTAGALNTTIKWALLAGAAYVAYENRAIIMKALK